METENPSERRINCEKLVRGTVYCCPFYFEKGKAVAEQKSFKTRVKEEAIRCARIYKDQFVDYDYLLCSEAFSQSDYYITWLSLLVSHIKVRKMVYRLE